MLPAGSPAMQLGIFTGRVRCNWAPPVRIPPDVSRESRAINHDRVGVTIETVISRRGLVCWATSKGAFKK
jgi:hypothetical protein